MFFTGCEHCMIFVCWLRCEATSRNMSQYQGKHDDEMYYVADDYEMAEVDEDDDMYFRARYMADSESDDDDYDYDNLVCELRTSKILCLMDFALMQTTSLLLTLVVVLAFHVKETLYFGLFIRLVVCAG